MFFKFSYNFSRNLTIFLIVHKKLILIKKIKTLIHSYLPEEAPFGMVAILVR